MITVLNPNKWTQQPFFHDLINYLYKHEDVTLREIKKEFADVRMIDKALENYIQAGYILRENRRYRNGFDLLQNTKNLALDSLVFVDTNSPAYQELQTLVFEVVLTNKTNSVLMKEKVDFARDTLTLSSYFYKLKHQYPLSEAQKKLYAILGDVNEDYAMKYMTSFLLKFVRKNKVMQKRRDIFVDSLVKLGYVEQEDKTMYCLTMNLDKEQLLFEQRK
ncbi:DUF1803 domain-containing protein [Streptococcus dentiloxodontae]